MDAPTPDTAAKTRFTYKHQRQERYSVSTPPSSKPTAPPAPAMAPNTPNAFPRSFGSVNVTVSTDSAAGAISAPHAPWQARATASIVKLVAAPPTADAAANPVIPARNVTFRPRRSASRPPNSSRLPNASAYAVTTHCRSTVEKCSARWAEGSAMFTIVASRITINWARPMTARISQRRGSGAAAAPPAAACFPFGTFIADITLSDLEDLSPLLAERNTKRRNCLHLG